jgi:hypothetical protein
MTTYESQQKQILKPHEIVYSTLSDLTNLSAFKDKIPADKVKDLDITADAISATIDPIGRVTFRIVEREPYKIIKFGADNLPVELNFWIQLVGVSEIDTRMKLTIKADIPMILKPMIGNKLSNGIEQIADMLTEALNK